jgi:hypothetical protein
LIKNIKEVRDMSLLKVLKLIGMSMFALVVILISMIVFVILCTIKNWRRGPLRIIERWVDAVWRLTIKIVGIIKEELL